MQSDQTISFIVNGQKYSLPTLPGETLAELLRNRLHLTGTKIGCNEAECGTCTVLVNGDPILSCTYPAGRVDGKEVLTIEGLAKHEDGKILLHPLQEAFIQHGAVQCGFCIPGQIMTAHALVTKNPDPSREEIRSALKDTLCRCAGYPSIENAIQAAATSMRSGDPVKHPTLPGSSNQHRLIGRAQIRPDAVEKVIGTARYTDDLTFDGMLFAAVRRSGVPHAIIKSINIQKAQEMAGVVTILTADDLPASHHHGLVIPDWPILVGVGERVRYVGDAIAIVAAETQEQAALAAELVEVEFDLQPVISDPVESMKPDAPALFESGNLLKHIKVRKGDMQQGFAEADIILEHTFRTPIVEHAFLEPECSLAVPTTDGGMEIYVGSQIPYQDREQVALALGWAPERVRVIGQLMGGGFGGKEDIAGQIHAALLADRTGQPVKLLFDRHESLLVHPKRHATQIRVKVGAKLNGRLTAVETELFGDTGAYASLGEKVLTRATTHSAGPYDVPHVKADCFAMYTNNPPAGAFRGFGVLQSAFAMESMMDMLAEKVGIDPIDLRRLNALKVGSITNTGQELRDSVGLLECIDKVDAKVHELSGQRDPFTPYNDPDSPHLHRAWGFAAAYKNTGLGGGAADKSGAEIELYPDGRVEIRTSAAELGQGLVSVLQMIVAEELSLPLDQVRVLVMDTGLTPDGGPTTASRQTYVTGNAARLASRALLQAITSTLAEKYDLPPGKIRYSEGLAHLDGFSIPLGEVAREMLSQGRQPKAIYEYWAPETKPLGQGGDMHFAFSFAAQAAEVEVNIKTGEVRILRVISANDVGQIINALSLNGQVEGGVMMGLGNAITEHFIVKDGYIVTDRLARYRMPSIINTPEITSIIVEHPTREGPYGAKGVGEIVSIPTSPAITNAIYHAVGVRVDELPVDQEKILWAIVENNTKI